jgi:DnaK suppressor protein
MAVKKKTAQSKATAKKKAVAKKTVAKKTTAKKSPVKKTVAKKTVAKKTVAKKVATKKTATKKVATKKVAAKKTASKAQPAKPATPKPAVHKAAVKQTSRASTAKATTTVGPVPGIAPYQEKKGEEYMSTKQLAHFRDILLTWKRELMEEVDRTVHHMQDEAANFPDPNDRATQESEFSMELRARDRERKLIKKIDESMDKLDDGEYGYCESCGVEIGIRRLEARPTATLCIDCKTLDEIREKQRG